MNPMYDFSTPRKAAASAPPPKRPNKKPGRRPSKAVLIGGLVAAVLVVGGGAFAYSRSQNGVSGPDPTFCATSVELAQRLTALGAPEVGPIPDPVRPEAIKELLTTMGARLDGLGRSAPSEIRADVTRLLTDLRAAVAGDLTGARSPGFASARIRIASFQQSPDGCQPAGSEPFGFG